MADRMIDIEKGDLKGKCMPSALRAWQRNGWTAVEDSSSEPVVPDPVDVEPQDEAPLVPETDPEE